jgi:hypothetical protein
MRLFLRYLFPATYFEATRVPSTALKMYNGLVEWIPAFALSLYFNDFRPGTAGTVLLSYAAFICLYEIGYLTNDYHSEGFEADPRGRMAALAGQGAAVYALIAARVLFFILCTWLLGVQGSVFWWTFHGTLLATFALHNILPGDMRVATFFGLSAYRFFGPIIVTLPPEVLTILLPAVLLNHSLYRTTVYLRDKTGGAAVSVASKFAFYAGCLPFSMLLSIFSGSWLPVGLCLYFAFIWLLYFAASRITGWQPGPAS